MWHYLLKRLLLLIVTLFGITVVTFVITRSAPGNPVLQRLQGMTGQRGEELSAQLIEDNLRIYGLDKPILLNFRNDNRNNYARDLIDRLLGAGRYGQDPFARERAPRRIREIGMIAVPHLVERAGEEEEPPVRALLLSTAAGLVPQVLRNEAEVPAETDLEGWRKWIANNGRYLQEVREPDLPASFSAVPADWFQKRGTFSVPFLIAQLNRPERQARAVHLLASIVGRNWVFPIEAPPERRRGKILADLLGTFRENRSVGFSVNLLENAVRSGFVSDPEAMKRERQVVVDRWERWWKQSQERFSIFEGSERWVRVFTATQYGVWVGKILTFDFDESYVHRKPVIDLIRERLPVSLSLSYISIFISYLIAIPLGVFSATHQHRWFDRGITLLLFILYSLPSFWVATMLQMFLTGRPFWTIFPTSYLHTPGSEDWEFWRRFLDWLWHLVLPVTCLVYGGLAFLSRQMRSAMLEVVRQDFIRTARAKGLSERVVIFKHALRNSLIPILTLLASLLPAMLGGSIIIEEIFTIRGMGQLSFQAIINRDYPVINGIFFFSALLTLLGILLADISYALTDPRIKFE